MPDDDIALLVQQGKKIDAIKLYRERTGVGLKEAKDAVEAMEAGREPPPVETMNLAGEVEMAALVRQGRKIDAIKLYRERTGMGLKEAKDAVEAMEAGQGPPVVQTKDSSDQLEILSLLEQGQKLQAIKLYRERTGAGLAEAKETVERVATEHGITRPAGSGCLGAVLMLAAVCLIWAMAKG